MPRYQYHCGMCDEVVVVSHLSDETETNCPKCFSLDSLSKLVTSFTNLSKKNTTKNKVGDVTERFIKDSKTELKKQKNDLKEKR